MAETREQREERERREREEREKREREAAAAAAEAARDRAAALAAAAAAAAAAQAPGFTPPARQPPPVEITPLPEAGQPPDTSAPAAPPAAPPAVVADIASIQVPKGLGAPGGSISPDHDAGVLSPKPEWIGIWNNLGAAFNGLEKTFAAVKGQLLAVDHLTEKVTGK